MAQLEDNLKLGLEAVKYAKSEVRRSGNQHYYKSSSPFKETKRNEFLLSATRGGSHKLSIDEEGGTYSWEKDDLMSQRRKEIEQIIASSDPQNIKDSKIDRCLKQWGKSYFRNWDMFESPGDGFKSRWELLTPEKRLHKMSKKTGIAPDDIIDASQKDDKSEINAVFQLFKTQVHAQDAKKFGTGNCGEKAEVAALYLLNRTPGGLRISLYQLDPKHKGVTGIITRAGGDHAFCVLGHTTVADNIGSLGPNAIIVDGWMNDAYPAQKYLTLKHGINYNNERINIKQHTIRSMVCCSYRSHIQCFRDFGIPPAGPQTIPAPTVSRTKF